MKKLISYSLLLILTLNLFGAFILFKTHQFQLKQQIKDLIKQSIPKSDLIPIVLDEQTNRRIIWEDEHEFSLNGMMFDIVLTEKNENNQLIYFCINDHEETKHIKTYHQINLLSNTSSIPNREVNNTIIKLLEIVYLPSELIQLLVINEDHSEEIGYTFNLQQGIVQLNIHPPKFI